VGDQLAFTQGSQVVQDHCGLGLSFDLAVIAFACSEAENGKKLNESIMNRAPTNASVAQPFFFIERIWPPACVRIRILRTAMRTNHTQNLFDY
jgi:hypothetical protein